MTAHFSEKKRLMTTTLTAPYLYYNKAPNLSEQATTFLEQANSFFDQQDILKTTEAYKNALEAAPQSPELMNNIGAILAAQGAIAEGAQFLKRAIETDNKCVGAHYNLGTLFISTEMSGPAREELEKAHQLDLNSAPILNNLGISCLQGGDREAAIKYFKEAIEKAPAFDYAYHNLGTTAFDQNNLDDATEWFHQSLERNAANFATLNDLACVLYLQDKVNEAIPLLKKAIEANEHYRLPYHNLGYIAYTKQLL
ncbi:MAG: tetratricopeptide repeat protein [Candidatus Babeliaceae bacterium]|nr:tetratricopeptide repeat protein [Candidatus Babeliaceae bacterium]